MDKEDMKVLAIAIAKLSDKERLAKALAIAITKLSREGVGRHNLYKFFLPSKVDLTIQEFGLNCSGDELSEYFKRYF